MALSPFIFTMTSDFKLLCFSNKSVFQYHHLRNLLEACTQNKELQVCQFCFKDKNLKVLASPFKTSSCHDPVRRWSPHPSQKLLGWHMGPNLFANRDRRQCFGKAVQVLRACLRSQKSCGCVWAHVSSYS